MGYRIPSSVKDRQEEAFRNLMAPNFEKYYDNNTLKNNFTRLKEQLQFFAYNFISGKPQPK